MPNQLNPIQTESIIMCENCAKIFKEVIAEDTAYPKLVAIREKLRAFVAENEEDLRDISQTLAGKEITDEEKAENRLLSGAPYCGLAILASNIAQHSVEGYEEHIKYGVDISEAMFESIVIGRSVAHAEFSHTKWGEKQ